MKKSQGIILFKKEDKKIYFLLAKNNLVTIDRNNCLYSDINSYDNIYNTFIDNTFGLVFSSNELKYMDAKNYHNSKYDHEIMFINGNVSNDTLSKINKIRSYFNSNYINNSNSIVKKDDTNYNFLTSEDIKWFELSEIVENPNNFENKFLNTFLKSIKNETVSVNL